MTFKKTFCVSDESINCYGFWIRTAGIKLENAKKNCPVYYNHCTWNIPLGHAENFRVEGDRLLADIIIEGGNEEEKNYIRKIENGDIKACSGGFENIDWTDEVLRLKEGQTYPTAWDSELFEISLAPLPGNKNALALKGKDGVITLSAENQSAHIPQLNTPPNMKQIALKLGLPESATEADIIAAIVRLKRAKKNADLMRTHIEAEGAALPEEQKALFTSLCKSDFASALSFLKLNAGATSEVPEGAAPVEGVKGGVVKNVKVSDMIQQGKQNLSRDAAAADGKETFDYLQKHNSVELARIRKDEPEKYAQLAQGYQSGVRYVPGK